MPANARSTGRGQRFYVWGRGERYWSVTTILGALPKDALKAWAAKVVAEFAFDRLSTWGTMNRGEAVEWLKREPLRYTADRADVGSAIHAAAEAYVLQAPIRGDFGEEERKALAHFVGWVETLAVKFVATEASVYNRTQKYAGTLDAILEIPYRRLLALVDGNEALVPWRPREGRDVVTLLVDYKTGGDVAEGKGVYPEVALQLAAYARAEFQGLPNGKEAPLPVLDGAAVLHVQAGGWRFVPVDALRDDVWNSFLYVREVFRWREVISKEVLGNPFLPPPTEIPDAHRAPSDEAPVDEAPVDEAPKIGRPIGDLSDDDRARAGLPPKAPATPGPAARRRRPAS